VQSDVGKLLDGFQDLASAFKASSASRGGGGDQIEVPVPAMTIKQEVLDWVPLPGSEDAVRRPWPFAARDDIDLEEYKEFLLKKIGVIETSVSIRAKHVQYFASMFDLPDEFDFIGFMAGAYEIGLASKVCSLPALSPERPVMRSILKAVDYFADHLMILANRKRYREAHRCITSLKAEVLAPSIRLAYKGKAACSLKKHDRDLDKLEKLPPNDTIQEAVAEAMLDLHTLAAGSNFGENKNVRFASNVMMLGIVYLNSYAGRPGEWAGLLRKEAEEFIESGKDTIKLVRHKAYKQFGALGRFVPPGNIESMKHVLATHPPDSKLFLQPYRAKKPNATIVANQLLVKFATVYTPGFQHCGPTLQRKFYHTEALDEKNQTKAFQILCEADCHSESTGRKHYALNKPEKDGVRTASIFKAMIGHPVPWPTESFLKAGRVRSIERIASMFSLDCNDDDDGKDVADDDGDHEHVGSDAGDGTNDKQDGAADKKEPAAIDLDSHCFNDVASSPPPKRVRLVGFCQSGSAGDLIRRSSNSSSSNSSSNSSISSRNKHAKKAVVEDIADGAYID